MSRGGGDESPHSRSPQLHDMHQLESTLLLDFCPDDLKPHLDNSVLSLTLDPDPRLIIQCHDLTNYAVILESLDQLRTVLKTIITEPVVIILFLCKHPDVCRQGCLLNGCRSYTD